MAFEHERQLAFRVKMPGGIVTRAADYFAMKRFPLLLRRALKGRFHKGMVPDLPPAGKFLASQKYQNPARKKMPTAAGSCYQMIAYG